MGFIYVIFNVEMSYTIKIADTDDPATDLVIRNLIKTAYNSPDIFPEKYLGTNLNSNASKPHFFLIAEENGEAVGCTGFLPNDFMLNGMACLGYQCCWSVTHPDHRGKKIFTSIINEGKRMGKELGASFMYAISNDNTNQILINKLDFNETPSLVLRIPNIPFLKRTYFTKGHLQSRNGACTINEMQVKEHKLAQFPSLVKVIQFNDSWIWGKLIHKKKLGISIPVFYVGGVQLVAERDLPELVAGIFRSHKAAFVQFFSCASHSFNTLLRGWKPSRKILFNYHNLSMPAFDHFNLMIGALDVF